MSVAAAWTQYGSHTLQGRKRAPAANFWEEAMVAAYSRLQGMPCTCICIMRFGTLPRYQQMASLSTEECHGLSEGKGTQDRPDLLNSYQKHAICQTSGRSTCRDVDDRIHKNGTLEKVSMYLQAGLCRFQDDLKITRHVHFGTQSNLPQGNATYAPFHGEVGIVAVLHKAQSFMIALGPVEHHV